MRPPKHDGEQEASLAPKHMRSREIRAQCWLEDVVRDLRLSFRSLRRSKSFSATVIITLALCIGCNTTIVSVLYGLILKPPPFRDGEQLVEIYNSQARAGQPKKPVSVAQYMDFKQNADLFEAFALWRVWTFNIDEDTDPARVSGSRVTADYFEMLGVQPLIGRFYTMEECSPGRDNVVVLTQSYWESHFGSDPTVVGRELRLTGEMHTIVGVAPRSLEALNVDTTLLKPFALTPQDAAPRRRLPHNFSPLMYARLKSGVTPIAALRQLTTLESRFFEQQATPIQRDVMNRSGHRVELGRFRAEQTKSVRSSLILLQASALFVLLLGCVNVANLMLARARKREPELAIRLALGAGRSSLVRQLLAEGLLLAVAGSAGGLVLAWAGVRVVNTYTTAIIREVQAVALDYNILGLTLLTALAVALGISLLSILRVWRVDLLSSIQSAPHASSSRPGIAAASNLLVVAQVAFSFILLTGAFLLTRSLLNVMLVDPGFEAKCVHHARVAVGESYQNAASLRGLQQRIIAAMKEIPGVESVAISSNIPVNGQFPVAIFPIGQTIPGREDMYPTAYTVQVTSDFFSTMGLRIIEGRGFTDEDQRPGKPPAFIVDTNFVAKHVQGRSAVGLMINGGLTKGSANDAPRIVGVVESAKFNGLEDRSGMPFVFSQMSHLRGFSILVRSRRSMADLLPLMRQQIRIVDPSMPLYSTGTLDIHLDKMLASRRSVLWLAGSFAGIALILTAVGISGMLTYNLTQRTKEFGIRSAIGASPRQIAALIIQHGFWSAVAGMVLGLAGTILLAHYMRSFLFELKPHDPTSLACVSLLVLAVALLASWMPGRLAAKIDPIVALRSE